MTGDRAAYAALALTPGIGAARMKTLLDACTTAHGALSAPFAFLCSLSGIGRAAASAVAAAKVEDGARVLERAAALGAAVLIPGEPAFPARLAEIPDPPTLLFAQGDLSLLDRPAVGVVGSRQHTAYGAEACRRVVGDAVGMGLVVVSGMARGLDAVAHAHALDLGGGTVGVLGNGLGVVYPAANRELYARVEAHGLLLTEFAPGERPQVHTFPRRNRLISGLSAATVVVEAGLGSGAIITADCALEQGRDVLAVPGPITSEASAGTNRLIRDGAAPYLEAADLAAHYPSLVPAARREPAAAPRPLPAELGAGELAILPHLEAPEPTHIDHLAERAGLPVADVLGLLCGLEIAGVVEQLPGRRFRRLS